MENRSLRTLFLVLLVLYILSPVDAVPGPIDDALVAVICFSLLKEY